VLPEQLPTESAKAYAAFVAYCEMGSQRSLEKVQQKYARNTSYIRVLARWSAQHRWQERVRQYDAALARAGMEARIEQYRQDVIEHGERYRKVGRDLHDAARVLLFELLRRKDDLDYSPALLGTIVRAVEAGSNLEAHSLSLDKLLTQMEADEKHHPTGE
jgi:hypothetical protein